MKKLKVLFLGISSTILLTSCGGVNLGKEVSHEELENAISKVDPSAAESKLKSIKIKFDYVVEGDVSAEEKQSIHTNFTLDENTDISKLSEYEQFTVVIMSTFTYEIVKKTLNLQGVDYKAYIGENPTTYGISCDYSATSSGVTSSLKGTYQWNEYALPKYWDEVSKISSDTLSATVTTKLDATYTFKS